MLQSRPPYQPHAAAQSNVCIRAASATKTLAEQTRQDESIALRGFGGPDKGPVGQEGRRAPASAHKNWSRWLAPKSLLRRGAQLLRTASGRELPVLPARSAPDRYESASWMRRTLSCSATRALP